MPFVLKKNQYVDISNTLFYIDFVTNFFDYSHLA